MRFANIELLSSFHKRTVIWKFPTGKSNTSSRPQSTRGKACHLPLELEHRAYWAIKYLNFNLLLAQQKHAERVLDLTEFRFLAYESAKIYKETMKFSHDRKLKKNKFTEGSKVTLYDSRFHLFLEKLKSRWTGQYIVKQVLPNGAIIINDVDNPKESNSFLVNGARLKPYIEGFVLQ
ncbi:uncharacterized protein LOC127257613 [Andrographis paniculata]|uniref:uncharacterized protein LOC127257613 n=1 Tax=Andrographis paniculata TaxID=175694 RepID=UPI0021E95277|nr:uncharacterized protein LOC127257613 [Andrographis paniculata]